MTVNLGKADEFILWTVEDLAELLDIQKDTIRKMLGSGELPAKKIARRWYVSNQALINWFNLMSPEFPIPLQGGDEWRPANKPRSVLIFLAKN